MFSNILCLAVISTLALVSCSPVRQQAYYVSPFNANHNSYHPIPLQEDTIPTAFYAGLNIYTGSANELETDKVFSVQTNLSGAHNFKNFQTFYSANLSFGNYRILRIPPDAAGSLNAGAINRSEGYNSFGGCGIDGGVNVVVPMPGGEWRIIGVETSVQSDFGKYLEFRENLRDSAATYLARSDFFGTFGGYTELLGKFNSLTAGIRIAYGTVLGSEYRNVNVNDIDGRKLVYDYLKTTMHLTAKQFTGYLQLNFSRKASGAFIGMNYRISGSKR
ncbi:MAG: hypothetical protein JWQ96_1974 [Segetibacter sp.]|nr:hypothetical protein [Segetibacter sp.]